MAKAETWKKIQLNYTKMNFWKTFLEIVRINDKLFFEIGDSLWIHLLKVFSIQFISYSNLNWMFHFLYFVNVEIASGFTQVIFLVRATELWYENWGWIPRKYFWKNPVSFFSFVEQYFLDT